VTTKTPRVFGFRRSRWPCAVLALLLRDVSSETNQSVPLDPGSARQLDGPLWLHGVFHEVIGSFMKIKNLI
jgi:hypothetical protein